MKFSKTLLFVFILISCVNAFSQKSESKLEIGTYLANGQATIYSDVPPSPSGPYNSIVKIKIKSINNDGNIKAEIFVDNTNGKFSGKLDSAGNLQMEGTLVYQNRTLYETKLTATIKDDTLINGKFVERTDGAKIVVIFKKAVVVEDDDE